jgi:hypothetical protein
MAKRLGNINPSDGKGLRLEDFVDLMPFPKKKWVQVRFLDLDILPVKQHWVNILAGKEHKEVNIPKFCVSFDSDTEGDTPGVHCPYCDLPATVAKAQRFYLANAIIREFQDDEPARKVKPSQQEAESGFKDKKSSTWTPVRVLRLPQSLAKKILDLAQLNKVKTKSGQVICYDVSHDKFGVDVNIKFDPDASGTDMYAAQGGERTSITPAEKDFLVYNLTADIITQCGKETEEQAEKELNRMELNTPLPDEDEDEIQAPKTRKALAARATAAQARRGSAPTSQAARRSTSVSVNDNDDEDEDEDNAPPPPRRPAPQKQVARRPAPATVDSDEDDADEDVAPPARRPAPPKTRQPVTAPEPDYDDSSDEDAFDPDEELDEDADDTNDMDDDGDVDADGDLAFTPPPARRPVPPARKAPVTANKAPVAPPARRPAPTTATAKRPPARPPVAVADNIDDDDDDIPF